MYMNKVGRLRVEKETCFADLWKLTEIHGVEGLKNENNENLIYETTKFGRQTNKISELLFLGHINKQYPTDFLWDLDQLFNKAQIEIHFITWWTLDRNNTESPSVVAV